MELSLVSNSRIAPLLIEECAYEGVRRIGEAVASDLELVTGRRPRVITEKELGREGSTAEAEDFAGNPGGSATETEGFAGNPGDCAAEAEGFAGNPGGSAAETVIFCATLGRSSLLDRFAHRLSGIRGKREVYQIFMERDPFPGVKQALVICGSDKRGTIYGMFALSEYLGVTPLVYWGDSAPRRWERPVVREDICTVSKEPSVYYRGFFINDEWPCFGTWVTEHFGGFNAEAYQHVFEFLLRMKGNYLWPAMWTASFPLDGPGAANEELADLYGVIMGYSHHEPCLRASEEWDQVRGEESPYGNEWNFYTNEQGLLRYWEDALKRSGKYENVITIGMRGERDTSMLGDDATVAENVALLKRIIHKQRQLIRRHVNEDLSKVPQMLALYKEVEAYFYGDGTVPGLKDWEELEDVICMLCEDNFGHMRTLPTEEIRNHRGGFGMYYHFDYHGGPVSHEWIDSTPFSKTWEQMCMAYEYGIRRLWIVNVGDIKFHEVPLTYFMNLAYDYEKWGSANFRSAAEFTEKWASENFGLSESPGVSGNGEAVQEAESPGASGTAEAVKGGLGGKIAEIYTEYIDLLSLRRPEALNEHTYHPCHYLEADRILRRVLDVEQASREVLEELDESGRKGYYSMVHYPLMAGMNLMKLHLYAGKNNHYGEQRRVIANEYGKLAEECIARDLALAEEFKGFEGGKWSGMQLERHIGFVKWNEDGCRYPVICRVTPLPYPRLSVSRKDGEAVHYKNYGEPDVIRVDDFLSAGCDSVALELANDGRGPLCCRVVPASGKLPEWLEIRISDGEGKKQAQETWPGDMADGDAVAVELAGESGQAQREVELCCLRQKLPRGISKERLLVTDGDTTVAVEISARRVDTEELPPMTFLPRDDVVVMDARHFTGQEAAGEAGFRLLEGYGIYGSGMKVFPVTASFGETASLQKSGREPGNSLKEESFAQSPAAAGQRPRLTYQFLVERKGCYRVELLAAPTNSPEQGKALRLLVSVEGAGTRTAELVGEGFRAGDHRDEDWCRGVLDQIRSASVSFDLEEGVQRLSVGAMEAGVVLERIRICPVDRQLPESYLGPEESYCSRKK